MKVLLMFFCLYIAMPSVCSAQETKGDRIKKAVEIYQKACDEHHSTACVALARAYYDDGYLQETERDYIRAAKIYQKSCDAYDGAACAALAYVYGCDGMGVEPDNAKSAQYEEKACESGNAFSCQSLGVSYVDSFHGGILADIYASDILKAVYFFQKGCNLGDDFSCENLGNLYSWHYQQSCDFESENRCIGVDNLYSEDRFKPDELKALQFYQKSFVLRESACINDEAYACENLGDMFRAGKGVRRNATKANVFYDKAISIFQNECSVEQNYNTCEHLRYLKEREGRLK
jgi:TPR repeat protein